MRLTQRTRRSGMTLIEILVVIAIIAILAGLLMAGVMGVFGKGDEALNRSDITQMSAALRTFQGKYGVLPPSQIYLSNSLAGYSNSAYHQYSLQYVKKIWPRIFRNGNVNWLGRSTTAPGFDLSGDKALVFFLGGMQSTASGNQTIGFATNPANPTDMSSTAKRHPVLYQFKSVRLAPTADFFQYKDVYGTPFLYHNTDGKVWVNASSPGLYYNPSNQLFKPFQLVSAGKDKLFGRGTLPATGNGEDDFANFTNARLGAGE